MFDTSEEPTVQKSKSRGKHWLFQQLSMMIPSKQDFNFTSNFRSILHFRNFVLSFTILLRLMKK